MSIISSDPLAFLTAQGGVVGTPLTEAGASGADNLDQKQRGAVIGEPIPIVFCRRTGGSGGVLISPPATEARFSDDASSNITASYHLVLSEGQIDSIQVRDVFQRACRVGSFTQTYDRRAGTFVAGNFIDNTPNLEAPTYCGTSGTYDGLSTMAFSITIPAGFDQWNRQVHCFIRGGINVTRLLDSVTGPSNNVADLLLYLLRNSSRVPNAMIDTATSFLAAATFTNANGFWFNGVVSKSTNLRDWISTTLQYFLLRQTRIGGKEALKPLVPTNNDGTIQTTTVSWVFTFTQQHISDFEITYTPLADRKPFCATVLWRQQDDLGIPVMRTAEVRYTGTAVDGPYEQHDLSGFCSTENHAVKVGAYILSKRRHVTHRLQLGVKPDAYNPTVAAGDLVRVRLERVASTGASSVHDYLYEVDRIGMAITGEVQLDLTHFPVDSNLASVVAQEVNAATGSGLLLPTGLSGITCDVNSSTDTSVPAETFTDETFSDYGNNIGELDESGLGDPPIDNPEDGIGGQSTPEAQPEARVGDVLTAPDCNCANSSIQWYRGTAFGANPTPIPNATSNTYTVGIVDGGTGIFAVITCQGDGSVCTSQPVPIRGWKTGTAERNDVGAHMAVDCLTTTFVSVTQANCPEFPGAACPSYNQEFTETIPLNGRFFSIEVSGDPSGSVSCGGQIVVTYVVYVWEYDEDGIFIGGYPKDIAGRSVQTNNGCSGNATIRIGEIIFKRSDGTVIEPPLPTL
jgi:hypothetical protein